MTSRDVKHLCDFYLPNETANASGKAPGEGARVPLADPRSRDLVPVR